MRTTQAELRQMAAADDHVIVDERVADSRLWAEIMQKCDLVVCPYKAERYRGAYSAVMGETIAEGIPVVGPSDTSLSHMAATFGSGYVAFEQWELADILRSTIKAIDQLDDLADKCQKATTRWFQTNSAEAFLKVLSQDRTAPTPSLS